MGKKRKRKKALVTTVEGWRYWRHEQLPLLKRKKK